MPTPSNTLTAAQPLRLVEATPDDLDRIMALEQQGFAAGHREQRTAYAQRIATFPQGSLMAWRGEDCVGCVFSEIWQATPQPNATHFALGHDIRSRHDPLQGTELYISSMTLAPVVRGQGLGVVLLQACLDHVTAVFPQLESAVLLVNATWTPARRIYTGLGFMEIGCLAGFFEAEDGARQDGIVMRRPIRMPAPQSPQPITHYENFPVASWLCPAQLRAPIAAIYHFARTADDIADEGDATPEQRLHTLQTYRQDLVATSAAANSGATAHEAPSVSTQWPQVFGPLGVALRTHHLPTQLLHDLLDAFEQDTRKSAQAQGYATHAELLDYCRRSANPVGRLLLHLYGVTDDLALQRSDAICSALQLINFWQDLSVDIPRGRYYLPQEDCTRFCVSQADILAQRQTQSATNLIASCVATARASMQFGSELVHQIPGRAGWELRLVVQGGLRILDRIEALRYATLNQRPTLRWWDFPVMLWRAVWM